MVRYKKQKIKIKGERYMGKKSRLGIFVICFIMLSINCWAEQLATFTYSQNDLNIMFVVDYSNSMNSNDKEKMGLSMIEAFVDEAFSKKSNVGFVAYNHTILAYSEPISLAEKSNRKIIKNKLSNIGRSGSTDIGLALKKAESLLSKSNNKQSVIILISDGEPDLSYVHTGRTIEDCYEDMNQSAQKCQAQNIPIYTIAFGENFDGETSCLETLSNSTGGNAYLANEAGDLVEIFNTILQKYTMSTVVPVAASLASGGLQTIEIPFESEYTSEVNVLLVSSAPLKEANIFYSGQEVDFSQAKYYFTCKINAPQENNVKLQYRTQSGEAIKVYLLLYQDVDFKVEVPSEAGKNVTSPFTAYFVENSTGESIADENFYKRFNSLATVYDDQGEVQSNPQMKYAQGKLIGELALNKVGNYGMDYELKENHYAFKVEDIAFKCVNAKPIGNLNIQEKYCIMGEKDTFNLDEYFSDPNGDPLTYSLMAVEGDSLHYELNHNELTLTPKHIGEISFKVVATDEEGETAISQLSEIAVLPVWRYYLPITLIISACILLAIIGVIAYILRKKMNAPKPVYSGKINVYFTKTPEDIEIEPLTFSFFQMAPHKITLNDLLEGAGYKIEEIEAKHIYFEPGFDRQIVFSHESQNAVMIGSSIACRKLKYSIAYGSKLYITAADESYDLEIHFVSARS